MTRFRLESATTTRINKSAYYHNYIYMLVFISITDKYAMLSVLPIHLQCFWYLCHQ